MPESKKHYSLTLEFDPRTFKVGETRAFEVWSWRTLRREKLSVQLRKDGSFVVKGLVFKGLRKMKI